MLDPATNRCPLCSKNHVCDHAGSKHPCPHAGSILHPPSDLMVTNIGQNQADVSWTPGVSSVVNKIAGYNVYVVVSGADVLAGSPDASPFTVTGLTAGMTQTVRVTSRDDIGNESDPISIEFYTSPLPDTTPPTDPTAFTHGTVTATSVPLTWGASTDDVAVAFYEVFLVVSGVDVSQGTTTSLSFTVKALTPSTSYTFKVQAVDRAGNRSNKVSHTVSTAAAAGSDSTPPTVPTGFHVVSVTPNSVTLGWTASTDPTVAGQTTSGVAGYDVTKGFGVVATPTGTTVTISNLAASTAYLFNVRARDVVGNVSAFAGAVTGTTSAVTSDTTPPTVPGNLHTTALGPNGFTVAWDASTDPETGVDHYRVYQPTFGGVVEFGTTTGTSLSVAGLSPSSLYPVRVTAVNGAGGESDAAALAVTTTAADTTYNRNVGIVIGAVAAPSNVNTFEPVVNGPGTSARVTVMRRGVEWPTVSPTSATPGALGSGVTNMVAAITGNGRAKLHAGLNYCPGPFQQTIKFDDVSATAVVGTTFLSLSAASKHGPPTQNGLWRGMSVHHPAIPSGANVYVKAFSSSNKHVDLTTDSDPDDNSPAYTLPASGTGTAEFGGTTHTVDERLPAKCGVNATSVLEPYGQYVNSVVGLLGSGVCSVELGNEVNAPMGAKPYVNVPLIYRNLCHAFCGAVLANPSIIVVTPGAAWMQTLIKGFMQPVDFFKALKAEHDTNQSGYFTALCTSLGVTAPAHGYPWHVLGLHPYIDDPTKQPAPVMDDMANVYNLFVGVPGGPIPIMATEFGINWVTSGGHALGAGLPLSKDGGADWYQAWIDYSHGNRRWDHTPFQGTDGATLSATSGVTLAQRRAAARNIFRPPLFTILVAYAGFDDYGFFEVDGTTQKWGAGRDPVDVLAAVA